jgi:hypothetical protein
VSIVSLGIEQTHQQVLAFHQDGRHIDTAAGDTEQPIKAYPSGPIVGRGLMLDYLDKFPNLNCDLSAGSGHTALSRDKEFTRKFLIDYQDRMFFGRDDYNNDMYDLLVSLNLPPAVLAKILAGNALRLVPV